MDRISVRYVFDRKKESNNSTKLGLLQVEVRIIGTSKKVFISTGLKLYKNQFSKKDGFTCKNHPNENSITTSGRSTFNKIQKFALSDKCNKIEDVKNWDKDEVLGDSIIDFIEKESRTENLGTSSLSNFNSFLSRLKSFDKIQTFSDLTYSNIADFDIFLKKYIASPPTLYKRHLQFRRYIKIAIKKNLCGNDPYDNFELKKGKHREALFLNDDELQKIIDFIPHNEKLVKTKDMFLFQCFTGMAYVDMQQFTKEDIQTIDGFEIIRSNRIKTDENFVSLLLPEAKNIAIKYNYQLPQISNQQYNRDLKLLTVGSGLSKDLVSHMGRHTYATYLLNKDIPIETVSRALGHSNIKQTQHYARLLGKKVIEDMKKLL